MTCIIEPLEIKICGHLPIPGLLLNLKVVGERGTSQRDKNGMKKKFEETYRLGPWTSRTKEVLVKKRKFG